jgi:hypothetical protein
MNGIFSCIFILSLAFILLQGPSIPSGSTGVAPASGTLSLVQGPASCGGGSNCKCTTSGSASCVMTVGTNPAAGNLDLFACHSFSLSPYGYNPISSVSVGGTLVTDLAWFGYIASSVASGLSYILPATSTGQGSATVTITMVGSGTNECAFYEYHPSSHPGNVNIDLDMASAIAATTSPTGPSGTFSGTNDIMIQSENASNGFSSPSAVTSPYDTNASLGNSWGASAAIPANGGVVPTWTLGGSIGVTTFGSAFGFNPVSFLEQSFVDMSGGSDNAHVTAGTLQSSTFGGAQGGIWSVSTSGSNQLFFSAGASMPLANPTGRLGNGVNITDTSTLGLSLIGDGVSADTDIASYTWGGTNIQTTPITVSFNYFSNLAQADTSDVDCAALATNSVTVGLNCYGLAGQRQLGLATNTTCQAALGGEQFIPVNTNQQYNIQINVQPGVSVSLSVYTSSGSIVQTTTYTNAACATGGVSKIRFGKLNSTNAMTNGSHIYIDSVKWDVAGTYPVTQ